MAGVKENETKQCKRNPSGRRQSTMGRIQREHTNCSKVFTYDPFSICIYCIYGNDVHLVAYMSDNVSTLHALLSPVQIILDVVLPV